MMRIADVTLFWYWCSEAIGKRLRAQTRHNFPLPSDQSQPDNGTKNDHSMAMDLDIPPHEFYTGSVVVKSSNSRYASIQQSLTERALEILDLHSQLPLLVLDLGCGSSTSGEVIRASGHIPCGVDIAPEMLLKAADHLPDDCHDSLLRVDVGLGLPFRPGIFQAALGLDLLPWLFRDYPGWAPHEKRIHTFFQSLHGCLQCGARAVFNFHPGGPDRAEFLTIITTRCGFGGGIRVDEPHSAKGKMAWLILEVGGAPVEGVDRMFAGSKGCRVDRSAHPLKKGFNRKQWIIKKKERQRKLGQKVANDSKYTGRSRRRWV
jgi:18S rRNA (guanine1575-N7)-methyltransferase